MDILRSMESDDESIDGSKSQKREDPSVHVLLVDRG